MLIRVTFKDPDALDYAVANAVRRSLADCKLPKDELEALYQTRYEREHDAVCIWFRYGEYVEVEINTAVGTAVVIPST